MFKKQKHLLAILLLFLSGFYHLEAQEAVKLSLQDALVKANQNNTNIRNSQIDLKIARKKIIETTAIGLPHFDIKADYTFLPKVPTLPASFMGGGSEDPNADPNAVIELGVKQNIVFDFTVSQLIFNGAYLVGLQASKVYYDLSTQNDEKTKLDVAETVTNTYQMILLAEESRKILSQNLENIDKTLFEVTEMYKEGFVELTDVDQLEVTSGSIKNAINQVDANLDVAYRLLKIQLGITENTKLELTDILENSESLTVSSLSLLNEAFNIERNVDYKLISTSSKLAELDYKREMSNFLPVIAGFYNHTEKWKSPIFDFAPKDVIGINMSLPIFSSGQRLSVLSQKRLALEKAENNREFVSNSLSMQSNQLKTDVKLKLEKYANQKRTKELSDVIYQRTLEKYKIGMATSMELMTSQNQYLGSLTNYYQSIYDLLGAKAKLEKVLNIKQ